MRLFPVELPEDMEISMSTISAERNLSKTKGLLEEKKI